VINGELRGGGSLRGQIRGFLVSQQRGKFVATGQYASPPEEKLVWSSVGAGGPKYPEQAAFPAYWFALPINRRNDAALSVGKSVRHGNRL
jgi:hypothetical protein